MKKGVRVLFFVILFIVILALTVIFSAKITGGVIFGYSSIAELGQSEELNFMVLFMLSFVFFFYLLYKTIFRESKAIAVVAGLLIAAIASFGIISSFGPVISLLTPGVWITVLAIVVIGFFIWFLIWGRKNTDKFTRIFKAIIIGYTIGYIVYAIMTSSQIKASLGILHKILTLLFYPMLIASLALLLGWLLNITKRNRREPRSPRQKKDKKSKEDVSDNGEDNKDDSSSSNVKLKIRTIPRKPFIHKGGSVKFIIRTKQAKSLSIHTVPPIGFDRVQTIGPLGWNNGIANLNKIRKKYKKKFLAYPEQQTDFIFRLYPEEDTRGGVTVEKTVRIYVRGEDEDDDNQGQNERIRASFNYDRVNVGDPHTLKFSWHTNISNPQDYFVKIRGPAGFFPARSANVAYDASDYITFPIPNNEGNYVAVAYLYHKNQPTNSIEQARDNVIVYLASSSQQSQQQSSRQIPASYSSSPSSQQSQRQQQISQSTQRQSSRQLPYHRQQSQRALPAPEPKIEDIYFMGNNIIGTPKHIHVDKGEDLYLHIETFHTKKIKIRIVGGRKGLVRPRYVITHNYRNIRINTDQSSRKKISFLVYPISASGEKGKAERVVLKIREYDKKEDDKSRIRKREKEDFKNIRRRQDEDSIRIKARTRRDRKNIKTRESKTRRTKRRRARRKR